MNDCKPASRETLSRSVALDSALCSAAVVPLALQRGAVEPTRQTRQQLQDKILSHGGEHVCWLGDEPHLELLLQSGKEFDRPIERIPDEEDECHRNTAKLWAEADDQTQIVTGYALIGDVWVPHSWLRYDDHEADTASARERYFGVVLDEVASLRFCYKHFLGADGFNPSVACEYPKVVAMAMQIAFYS
jgi:hypothetical protein